MSSNYSKIAPTLKKSFVSGTGLNQGLHPTPNLNDNYTFKNNTFTSNIGFSNICYPLNNSFQTSDLTLFDFSPSSNTMISSADFNVIKIDISSNKSEYDTRLDVYYSHDGVFGNADIRYSTIISGGTNFYRNYPIENEFFSISLRNLGGEITTDFSNIEGRVTLSKYTQYNAPVQVGDQINRFNMGSLIREGSNFELDVVNDLVQDVKKVSRQGIMPTDLGKANMNLWGAGIYNDFSVSNDYRPLVIRSVGGNASNDFGKVVTIKGIATNEVYVVENVTLAGTSNAFTIAEYKFIGDMFLKDGGEVEGDYLICADSQSGIPYNYMDGVSNKTTSLAYTVPSDTTSIITDISLNGRTNLVNESIFNLKKINFTSNSVESLYQNRTTDSDINTVVPLNVKLDAGDCIIGEMREGNTSNITTEGITTMVGRLNIYEFVTSDDKII